MRRATISLYLVVVSIATAQTADKSLTFEVASIKPATPPTPNAQGFVMFRGPSGGPGTKDPGRINYPYMTLKSLLTTAYDVKSFQISGPAWLDTERFDVTATLPPDTTKEQFRIMLQNLLAERFKLAVHKESKEMPVYSLIVAKGGPKLKEAAPLPDGDGPSAPPPPSGPPKIGPDGFPQFPSSGRPGLNMIMMPGRARFSAVAQTMQDLATRLTTQLNRPVTDNTGLTAKYDFVLTFSPEGLGSPLGPVAIAPPPPPPPGAGGGNANVFIPDGEAPQSLFAAVQSQLGLKLEPKKGDVDMIVVDRMEKVPTEN